MGYTTEFEGVLKFSDDISLKEYVAIEKLLEDGRNGDAMYDGWIQLEISDDRSGIQWDGTEKFYHAEDAVNFIINKMRERWPNFSLHGEMIAQGENISDRWILRIGDDGCAHRVELVTSSKALECPYCAHQFYLDAEFSEVS